MNSFKIQSTLAACLLTCLLTSPSPAQSDSGQYWHTNLSTAQRVAKTKNLPLLVHFSAQWCVPCKKMEKDVLNRRSITSKLNSEIVAVKIDGDLYRELLTQFGIDTYPTDIVLNSDGVEIARNVGDLDLFAYSAFVARSVLRAQPIAKPNPVLPENSPLISKKTLLAGLNGYCPVTLSQKREWVKGSQDFTANYKQISYHFRTSEARDLFKQTPRKYAPQLLGCDPVVLADSHRAVPGRTKYGAFFDDKLFLFSNSDNRKKFKANPLEFTKIRHVLKADDILKTAIVPRESR